MRVLAIECATEACSVALFEGDELLAGTFEVLGRGHAERLVPMISELPDKGLPDRILVSLGPGSFTGVRIGLAAARALGLAWGAEVLGYPTLALVAAMALETERSPVTVCMNGGHGEWFVQDFNDEGLSDDVAASRPPQEAARLGACPLVAGNRAQDMVALLDDEAYRALDMLPDARKALLVPDILLGARLTPIYGRAPDARLPGIA